MYIFICLFLHDSATNNILGYLYHLKLLESVSRQYAEEKGRNHFVTMGREQSAKGVDPWQTW